MSARTPTGARVWIICDTHDIRFLTRSPESVRHHAPNCSTRIDPDQSAR